MNKLKSFLIFVVFLISIYIIYKLVIKLQRESGLERFDSNEDLCGKQPKLLDVNYETGTNKEKENYYSRDDNKYEFIIEGVQPFHNSTDSSKDLDEVGEVKQSHHFVWVMNRARNRLVRAERKKLKYKKFDNVFAEPDTENIGSKLITAWGVSADESKSEQYVCIFVKDFSDSSKNYLVLFKAKETGVQLYVDINNLPSGDVIYKKVDKEIYGDIYFKKNTLIEDDNYTFYFITKDSDIGKLSVINYVIDKTKTPDIKHYSAKNVLNYIQESNPNVDISADMYIEPNIMTVNKNINKYKKNSSLSTNYKITELDFIKDIHGLSSDDSYKTYITSESLTTYKEGRYNFYRTLCRFLEIASGNMIFYGIINFRVVGNFIYLVESYSKDADNITLKCENKIQINKKSPLSSISINIDIDRDSITKNMEKIVSISTINDLYKKDKEANLLLKDTKISISTNNIKYLDTYKKDISKFYTLHQVNSNQNVMGVLELEPDSSDSTKTVYETEKSPVIRSNVKHPRRVIFTLYQDIVNKAAKDINHLGRYNTIAISKVSSECIPSIKFTYDKNKLNEELEKMNLTGLLKDGKIEVKQDSLYHFFKNNVLKPTESFDSKKFLNLGDWIYMYDSLRGEGYYDIKNKDNELNEIKNSFENNPFFAVENPSKWQGKHLTLLRKNKDKIYETNTLKIFPNMLLFNLSGDELKAGKEAVENKVYIHLQYNIKDTDDLTKTEYKEDMANGSEEPLDSDFNLLKLDYDLKRGDVVESPIYSETIDQRKYDFYKLSVNTKKYVLNLGNNNKENVEKNKYVWIKRIINNFDDFKELVLGKDVTNESDPRDRLRGLYELNDMYVDDNYIEYLEKTNSTQLSEDSVQEIIDNKKKIRDSNVVYEGDNGDTSINKIGYPFIVFYKYIDYNGLPCDDSHINRQKIFLSNRLLVTNILEPNEPNDKTEEDGGKVYRYPLIKQEFLSFSGYGNIIQYYERKFGGTTDIETKSLCGKKQSDFVKTCSQSIDTGCNNQILSYVTLGGKPKCEINDPEVVRKNASPVEVLVPMAVLPNACDVYILKGKMKIYFSLGKIFKQGVNKFQLSDVTVKNDASQYLYLEGDKIIEKSLLELKNDEGEVKKEFRFKPTIKSDKYGSYYLLSPTNKPNKYLTSKIHLFQHTLGGKEAKPKLKWSLDNMKKEDVTRNHLNDEDFYSQKFIMNDSLVYNLDSEGEGTEAIQKLLRLHRMQQSLAAKYFPDLATGQIGYMEPMTVEEEQRALEKLLNDVNSYLKQVIRIRPVDLQPIVGLADELKKITTNLKNRVSLIKDRLDKIKYSVEVSDELKTMPSIYSKFKLPESENLENNISSNSNNKEQVAMVQQMSNALDSIKNFVPKSTRTPQQCKSLYEGFESMYKPAGKYDKHLVDKYNSFVTERVQGNKNMGVELVKNIKDNLVIKMKDVNDKIKSIKLEGKKEQLKLSEEIERGYDLEGSIHKVKEYEQVQREKRVGEKIKEIEKLRCELGDITHKTKVKDHPHYNSIISREDGSLLNIYKLNQCDCKCEVKNDNCEKCEDFRKPLDDKNLGKNMIFVNGGCLSYDEVDMKMNVSHCMVNDTQQHFELHKMEDLQDLNRFNIRNNGKELEKGHIVISKSKVLGPSISGGPTDSKYSSDICDYNYAKFNTYTSDVDESSCPKHEDRNLCLHIEGGEVSMRNCNNLKHQQWDHSNITGPCK